MAALQRIVVHAATKPHVYLVRSVWLNPTVPHQRRSGGYLDHGFWPATAEQPALAALVHACCAYPNVMFGITNEPERNSAGAEDAAVWAMMNLSVQTIRARKAVHNSKPHLVAVRGRRNWAGHIDDYVQHPITAGNGQNVVYEIPVYQPSTGFDAVFVQSAKHLPVLSSSASMAQMLRACD